MRQTRRRARLEASRPWAHAAAVCARRTEARAPVRSRKAPSQKGGVRMRAPAPRRARDATRQGRLLCPRWFNGGCAPWRRSRQTGQNPRRAPDDMAGVRASTPQTEARRRDGLDETTPPVYPRRSRSAIRPVLSLRNSLPRLPSSMTSGSIGVRLRQSTGRVLLDRRLADAARLNPSPRHAGVGFLCVPPRIHRSHDRRTHASRARLARGPFDRTGAAPRRVPASRTPPDLALLDRIFAAPSRSPRPMPASTSRRPSSLRATSPKRRPSATSRSTRPSGAAT